MCKFIAAAALCVLSSVALAHEDMPLPIGRGGTLGNLPPKFGPVKVLVGYSSSDPQTVRSVTLTSPRFGTKLNSCVLAKLGPIVHVVASGSWYHNLSHLPPYVSVVFFTSDGYNPSRFDNNYYSITFSLTDGHILLAEKVSHHWWSSMHGAPILPPDKCSGWSRAG